MGKSDIIVAIDIGSSNVRTVIAEYVSDMELPRVIGVGLAPSGGMRKGVIVNTEEAVKSINESLEKSERMAGVTVKEAAVSVGGAEVSFQNSKGVIAVGRADGEVTEDDLERAIKETQNLAVPLNREIVHIVPKAYRLDDQDNIKDPLGMKGVRLELDALVIEVSSPHIKSLTKCIEQAGVEVTDLILEPLASAKAILNNKQKELGVAILDIGGATTSLAVFEEGELLHVAILPVGSAHVTNDIAIGLRTSIEVAEKIKLEYGSADPKEVGRKEEIDLAEIDSSESGSVLRYHVAEIIQARMEEIFSMVNKELKAIGKAGLLPAGVVLTGGGSKLSQLTGLAKESLRLPIQIGYPLTLSGITDKVDDPSFATAIGLLLWEKDKRGVFKENKILGNISQKTGGAVRKVHHWLEKFLP
jgi:cell division protein FtsA